MLEPAETRDAEILRSVIALLYITAAQAQHSELRGYVIGLAGRFLTEDQRAIARTRIANAGPTA